MDYKYNELDYAEIIYCNGLQSTYINTELKILSTYMRRVLNYKPKKLQSELYSWCGKNISEFSKEKYYRLINSAIAHGVKKGSCLIKIDSIPIYDYELEYIDQFTLLDYECRKLMFTLLVQTKLDRETALQRGRTLAKNKYFKGGSRKYNALKKMANLKSATRINEDLIYELSQNSLVTPAFNGLIILKFIEELQQTTIAPNTSPSIIVENYNNTGWYYDYYCGQSKMALCKSCGQPFKKNSNNQLTCCKECGLEMDKKKAKERMNHLRSNQNILLSS